MSIGVSWFSDKDFSFGLYPLLFKFIIDLLLPSKIPENTFNDCLFKVFLEILPIGTQPSFNSILLINLTVIPLYCKPLLT